MKLRKTRIKETTKANGSKVYSVEYKWGFFWYDMFDMMAPESNVRMEAYNWLSINKDVVAKGFKCEQAKNLIEFYIDSYNRAQLKINENQITSVKCERYP